MNKKWTLHVENFAKIKSADVTIAPLMCLWVIIIVEKVI